MLRNNFLNAIFLVFVSFSFLSAKASCTFTCPPNYTCESRTYTLNGCSYQADLCIFCGLTYPGGIDVKKITLLKPSPSGCETVDPQDIIDELYLILNDPFSIWLDFCPNYLMPDCPTTDPLTYSITYPTCWKVKKAVEYGDFTNIYLPCGDEKCKVEYEYCLDGDDVVILSETYSSYPAQYSCTFTSSDILPSLPLVNVGDETECFINTLMPCPVAQP